MDALRELVGESAPVRAVRERIQRLLERQTDARRLPPILLQGETGTGKGLIARALHRASQRRGGPFVDVNCAAIPETLLEAEMFGFERGAFTDARQAKAGLFQTATGGSIFLDEVALLPEALQAKLLKVIEERSVRRLGSTRNEPIDVWIITGTNEDLAASARDRRFRDDLYHRLAVVTIALPPLRERGDDAVLLGEHFLARACADYDLPGKTLDASARQALLAYRWPGNVRELANVMERVALLSDAQQVNAEMLGLPDVEPPTAPSAAAERPLALDETVEALERQHLIDALEVTRWNVSRAAIRLGLSRNAIRWRIEKYGLHQGATSPRHGSRRRSVQKVEPEVRAHTPSTPAARTPDLRPAPTTVRWERRRVSLLRADLAPPSPHATVDLGRQLPALLEKVQIFGGRIEELGATRVLAAFGLEPVEDAPRRAANAALAMRRAAERSRDSGDDVPWAVRIALHVVEGQVGHLGGGPLLDHDAKHAAWTRLDTLIARAEPGEVVVSETIAPFLERRFDFPRAEGVSRLGGAERAGLGRGGRMARFTGRERELDLLRSRYETAASGRGQVVGIVGEAGIGKSRLLYEFRQALARQRATCLEAHCVSYGTETPYLSVLDVLQRACGIEETDTPEVMDRKARERFQRIGLDAEAAPYLLELLGLKAERDALISLAPEVVKARTFDALRQLAVNLSREQPLVLIVEDLHWADRTSEEFFATLAETVIGARILLVCAYRPGYHPSWIDRSYATQMAIQALASEDCRSIVRSLLDETKLSAPLVELIVSKADGNPFFVEELARTFQEHPEAATTLSVPDTVQEVLLARIDRLPAGDRRLLTSASVIGKDVPLGLLREIADVSEDTLLTRLRNLRDAEFLLETRFGADVEYTFKHALTHDVAYASLPDAARCEVHARLVEVIERLHADRLDEHVERLAHHAVQGRRWDKALTYLRQAGERAAARSAHREAALSLERALEVLGHLPESRETMEAAIAVRLALRSSLLPLGEFERIFNHLLEAERLAVALDDQARLGRVCAYVTDYFRQTGDHRRAIEYGERALAIATRLGDFPLQIASNLYVGHVYHDLGDYRRGAELFRRNSDALTDDLRRELFGLPYVASVHSRTWLVLCLAELGEFEEALAAGEDGRRIAEALAHPSSLTSACTGLGRMYVRRGEFARAIPILEEGLELGRRWNIRLLFPMLAETLGLAYVSSGRTDEARALLEKSIEQHSTLRGTAGLSIRLASLGQALLRAGRVEDARRHSERSLDLARQHEERGNEAHALWTLGEIALDAEPGAARDWYERALALAGALGMRPLVAHCHRRLGHLAQRDGRTDADDHGATATTLFAEMGMRVEPTPA